MSFFHQTARQPEILRTAQKDQTYSEHVGQCLADILRFSHFRAWIKYSNLCKIIGDITYHAFATCENVQTLGEEYTGIIRIDHRYISLPTKLIQLTSIALQFGAEPFIRRLLRQWELDAARSTELTPAAREMIIQLCQSIRDGIPYLRAMHRSWFYIWGGRYHISKQMTGINYVLIRHWLNADYSIRGYKILGYITIIQIGIAFTVAAHRLWKRASAERSINGQSSDQQRSQYENHLAQRTLPMATVKKCSLCLEPRNGTSMSQCGHLFCWYCIMDWLDQKEECPVCREPLTKSRVVILKNFD